MGFAYLDYIRINNPNYWGGGNSRGGVSFHSAQALQSHNSDETLHTDGYKPMSNVDSPRGRLCSY